jgi:hypothetical protein
VLGSFRALACFTRKSKIRIIRPYISCKDEKRVSHKTQKKPHENDLVPQTNTANNSKCAAPRLKKFQGRAADISPKARAMQAMGYVKPFDRHDWVVDRCGEQVLVLSGI